MSNPLLQSLQLGIFGKISNSPTKMEKIEELILLLNTVPVGMETPPNHSCLEWKHESNVDGFIILSAFPSQQNVSIVEFYKILCNNGLDDRVSIETYGSKELRKILSDHLLNHRPSSEATFTYHSGITKKTRDHFYNPHSPQEGKK